MLNSAIKPSGKFKSKSEANALIPLNKTVLTVITIAVCSSFDEKISPRPTTAPTAFKKVIRFVDTLYPLSDPSIPTTTSFGSKIGSSLSVLSSGSAEDNGASSLVPYL